MTTVSLGVKQTLLLTSTLTVMAGATIAPSLPKIAAAYDFLPSASMLTKMILTLPALVIALTGPFIGRALDKWGRVRLLISALVLYGLCGAAPFLLEDIFMILICRAFLGLAVSIIMTATNTLIGDYFPPSERSKFLGLQGVFMAAGGVVFISLGGFLADISWRLPFLIYSVAFLGVPMALSFLREMPMDKSELENHEKYRPSWRQMMIFSLAFAGMIVFYMIPVQVPFLLKEMSIEKSSMAGIAIATTTVFGALISSFYSKILRRLSYSKIYVLIFLIGSFGYLLIFLATQYWMVISAMAVSGLAFGMLFPNTNMWLIQESKPHNRGRILGILTFSIFMGQFFSPILFTSNDLSGGLSRTFLYAAIFLAVVGVVLFFTYVRKHARY